MIVFVDTPVWSEYVRRPNPDSTIVAELGRLVEEGEATLIGPVRQEVLSSVRDPRTFERLRHALRGFPDFPLEPEDFETAARYFNICRLTGIQGSNTDFLLSALAVRYKGSIFTMDLDYQNFARALPISLHAWA